MRYLVILDASLLALAGTLALCLGVVCILYGANAGISARFDAEMPTLVASTIAFTLLTIVLTVAFFGALRRMRWLWTSQAAGAVSLAISAYYFYHLYT